MRDLAVKLNSFFNRSLRYFVFSTLMSFGVCLVMIIGNLFAGVFVSLSFYLLIFSIFDVILTISLCLYNSHKLFMPINRKLIKKLEQEEVERAREFNRRRNRRYNDKVS